MNQEKKQPKDKRTLDMKLGEVLRDAGLITSAHLEKMLDLQKTSGENLGTILKREVSLDSLKALMKYEIPLPFGKSASKQEVKSVLLESGIVTDEELSKALGSDATGEENLGNLLVQRGIITSKQLAEAKMEQVKTGLPFWRTLINMKIVTPVVIANLMKTRLGKDVSAAKQDLLLDILKNAELISDEHVEEAIEYRNEKGESVINYILDKGYISIDKISETFENVMDIPFYDIRRQPLDPDMMFVIPQHVIRGYGILPLKVEEKELFLGMLDPLNQEAINRAQMITGLTVKPFLIREEDWKSAIDEIISTRAEKGTGVELERILKEGTRTGMLSREDVSAVQMASSIIDGAINARATDIHLEPQQPEMRVRYRIDGVLYDVMSIPKDIELPVISRFKLLSNMDITEKRRPQDGHFSMQLKARDFNFRTATMPTYLGEKMTIRFLDEARVLKGLKQLGLESVELAKLQELINKPHGQIIVTGPIGSGKTTTLYAALNQTDILNRNVVTLEDPVEYRLAGINQTQVNPAIGLNFRAGLRALLRHDADIIMVGEVRDAETARVATWAALTGQLVFCTLHTNHAAGAITMLQNFDIENFLISSSLNAIVAQRLVRQLCPKCKKMVQPNDYIRNKFELGDDPDIRIGEAVGCEDCFQTGFQGRTGVFEILIVDKDIQKLIIDGAPDTMIEDEAVKKGMHTMWENGKKKILEGVTTPQEVMREVVL